jgi:hypothetical protein
MSALQEFFGIEAFDFETNKKRLVDNLNNLKSMSVEEQTFYKKWQEIQTCQKFANKAGEIKAKIWSPSDLNDEKQTIDEIQSINPTIVHVDQNNPLNIDWTIIRIFGHTMCFDQTPGRFLKFLVTDGDINNPRYIGAISVSSDVIAIRDRDEYIGWTNQNRIQDKKLAHSSIGSCIMSTQPIGYNFLGGKLVAAMITTKSVRDIWQKLYNQVLVGMTTTSLYGSYSMYNSLKWWHKCGSSAGKIPIKPDDAIYEIWHDWLKENCEDQYKTSMTQKEGVSGPVTGAKNRVLSMIFNKCNIKQSSYEHGYERGVYYSCFYENTKDFLQNKISEDQLKLKDLYKKDVTAINEWWKPKAIDRYKKLKSENNLKPEIHFYNKMIGMTYDEAKNVFFKEVGR